MKKYKNSVLPAIHSLAPIMWAVGKIYAHASIGKRRQHYRDVLLFVLYTQFKSLKHPNRPRQMNNKEAYEMLAQYLAIPDEREIEMSIPVAGGQIIEIAISAEWFFEAIGMKIDKTITVAGLRDAVDRGEDIFKKIKIRLEESSQPMPHFFLVPAHCPRCKSAMRSPEKAVPEDFEGILHLCQLFRSDETVKLQEHRR